MKKVFLFQCVLKTKLLKLDLACVHLTFYTVTFCFFMNVNFIRHWRMLSHLCRIRVLWFPLKGYIIMMKHGKKPGEALVFEVGYYPRKKQLRN